MANYIIKHSDPANGSFSVQSDQIDGTSFPWNAALYTNPASGLTALTANTSLVFAGQGVTDYGQLIQNNFVYLMEHFSYKSRPLNPVQGQIWYKNADYADSNNPSDPTTAGLYIWDGTQWSPILAANVSGTIDLAGARLINVGAATADGDALNRITADGRYLRLSGGTVTGGVTFSAGTTSFTGGSVNFGAGVPVTITQAPTLGEHATNKTYVDTQTATVAASVTAEAASRVSADNALQADIDTINTQLASFVQTTGDTMIGTLSFDPDASIFAVSGGTGSFSFGLKRLQQVGEPVANADATTKFYVDTAISDALGGGGGGSSDGVVFAGVFDEVTGVLSLQRTEGLPDVVVSGNFAAQTHTHTSNANTHDLSPNYSQSTLAISERSVPGYPIIPVYNALLTLDQQVTDAVRPVRRKLLTADGTTTTFNLTNLLTYSVEEHKLQVFVDGIKQYADERGKSIISFSATPINPQSTINIPTGLYTFDINVDGAGVDTISVTIAAGETYLSMAEKVAAALNTATVPVSLSIDQYYNRLDIHFLSHTSGAGSSVFVSYQPGELFETIATSTNPVNSAVTTDMSYFEVGLPGEDSTSITFNVAPTLGSVIEVLLFPG